MNRPASIELHLGPDRLHRVVVVLLWLLALANTAPHAETLAWPLLAAAVVSLAALNPWFQGRAKSLHSVQIFRDGTAITSGVRGTWQGQCWTSPWATVLRLQTPACSNAPRVAHVLVCASRNSADNYRHLLVWNRYPPAPAHSGAARAEHKSRARA